MIVLLFSLISLLLSPIQSATITLSPKTLNKSGDSVLIRWSGVDSPSELDWLGIYSPPNSPHDNFIGYKFLSSSPSWQSGSGSISLPLTNLRSNYSFRIFRWTESEINPKHQDHDRNPLPGTRHLLAQSDELTFRSLHGPEQVHLAYTESLSEMRVMFVAGDGDKRYVRYGERIGEWLDLVVARVARYEREHMCDSPANTSLGWRDPGWVFDAVMKNLKGGLRYYYQVIDVGNWVLSFYLKGGCWYYSLVYWVLLVLLTN